MKRLFVPDQLLSFAWLFSVVKYTYGLPHSFHKARDVTLNSTYLDVRFGQPRAAIDAYSLSTMHWVASHHYHPGSYLESGFFALAEWDKQHDTKTFEKDVNSANKRYVEHPGKCYSFYKVPAVNLWDDFPGWVSLGVLEAQEAYNTSEISVAEGVFQFMSDHAYITQADINAGYLVGTKSSDNHLPASCNGQSMLAGVYEQNGCPGQEEGMKNATVSAVATTLHALVGAKLCRMTGNTTYCEQAYSSLQFVDRILKQSDGLIADYIDANTCTVTTQKVHPYNAGLYISAYADLGNFTNNATALSLAQDTAMAAMVTSRWNTPSGIIFEGDGHDLKKQGFGLTFRSALIRFLHQSYPYVDTATQVAILQYINIQYYAVTQLDSNNPTAPYKYGRNWTGKYEDPTDLSMVTVLEVLNGISLNPDSNFPTAANKSAPVAFINS